MTRNTRREFWRLGMLLTSVVLVPLSAQSEIPRRIAHVEPMAQEPIWLSADQAVDASGGLNRDLLPRLLAGMERRNLIPGECVYFGPSETTARTLEEGFLPNSTVFALTRHSKAIYVGEVEEIQEGFYAQHPGSLLRVRLEDAIKRSPVFEVDDHLLVHYPAADFDAGGYRFCKEDPRYLPLPAVGDRIIVFADRRPLDRDEILISPGPTTIFVEPQGEELRLPERVRDDANVQGVRDLAELTNRITSILRSGAAEK